ncbi:MAG: VOC family protein [Thermomicrobiales bacterium]|nr:VOC family protein [Thermomicrobiales bacterium]
MVTAATQSTPASIDARTVIGELALTVADLDRSIAFYTGPLGFQVLSREGGTATLGAGGRPLLHVVEQRGARPWPGYATGLYHFAVLLPTRADLGRWLRNWLAHGYPLPGQGDHLVSEALYLSDPDGNGIEVYRDRPRGEWQWDGDTVRMASLPVDIDGLLTLAEHEGAAWSGFPAETTIGHMHLQVGDIPQAATYYRDVLGFDLVASMPSALFVSAGGYHHHIGLNTWHSRGASPAPEGTAGLRFFTIDFADEPARAAVIERVAAAGGAIEWDDAVAVIHDPWRNELHLRVVNG